MLCWFVLSVRVHNVHAVHVRVYTCIYMYMYVELSLQFGNLAKLQTQVNGENIKQTRLLEERDEMLQQVSCIIW